MSDRPDGKVIDLDTLKNQPYEMPYVERCLVGYNAKTYVHGYTLADAKLIAAMVERDTGKTIEEGGAGTKRLLKVYQVMHVCRVAPYSTTQTFQASFADIKEYGRLMLTTIPATWIDAVCTESDGLALHGYIPITSDEETDAKQQAQDRLLEQVSQPQFQQSMEYLSMALFGKPLCEHSENVGTTLNLLLREREAKTDLINGLYRLMQAAQQV